MLLLPTTTLLALLVTAAAISRAAYVPTATLRAVNHTYTPRDKFGFVCEQDGNDLVAYLFGGRESSTAYTSDTYMYSFNTGQWTQLYATPAISGVAAMGLAKFGKMLYLFGGQTAVNDGGGVTNHMFRMDLSTLEWVPMNLSPNTPSPRRRFAQWVDGPTWYLFGGLTGIGATSDVYSYNFLTGSWTSVTPASNSAIPSARFDSLCAFYNATRAAVCFGGTTNTGDSDEVWVFYVDTLTWVQQTASPSSNAPSARRIAMGAIRNGELLVWGGFDSASGQFVSITKMYFLNLATWTWRTPVAQIPEARDSGAMCSDGSGRVMLTGGARNSGRSNEVFRIDSASSDTFYLAFNGGVRPTAREGHALLAVGQNLFLFFGYDGAAYQSDVWTFDTQAKTWTALTTSGTKPTARRSACVTARGNLVFVHGGEDASGPKSDMYTFSTSTYKWTTVATSGTTPGTRSHHSCWMHTDDVLVTGLGVISSSGTRDANWFAYNVVTHQWYKVSSVSGTSPVARQGAVGVAWPAAPTTTPGALVGLGIGSATYNDRWLMSNLTLSQGSYTATWTALNVSISGTARQYIRGATSAVLIGNHLLVCGGALSSSFPAALDNICFTHDFNTGESVPFAALGTMVTAADAAYVGNTMYVFGGRLCSATVLRDVRLNTLQTIELQQTCAFGQSSDSGCVHCSAGTLNPSCAPTPAGTYATVGYQAAGSCATGQYLGSAGARSSLYCLRCPAGTYSSSTGSATCTSCGSVAGCSLGSTSPNGTSNAAVSSGKSVIQPAQWSSITIPWILVVLVGVPICLVFIFAVVWIIRSEKSSLKSIDLFTDGHRTGHLDVPLKTAATTYGGVLSVLFILGAMTMIAALVTNHFYNNIVEVKSGVPLPVADAQFPSTAPQADITMAASIAGPLHTVNGNVTTAQLACVVAGTKDTCVGTASFDSTASMPTSGTLATSCVFASNKCTMTAVCRSCALGLGTTVKVNLEFGPSFSATFIDYTVAATTGIRNPVIEGVATLNLVGSDTALSSFSDTVTPASSSTVLSGFPQTTVPVGLTATYFTSPRTVSQTEAALSSPYLATGYHVEQSAGVTAGGVVDQTVFDQFFGVPVQFVLTTSGTTVLVVTRSLGVTDIDFISSILGSVAGLASVTLILVHVLDHSAVKKRMRRYLPCCSCVHESLWVNSDDEADGIEIPQSHTQKKSGDEVGAEGQAPEQAEGADGEARGECRVDVDARLDDSSVVIEEVQVREADE